MKRLECLDGLRGVLAVYVMLGHMAPFAALPNWIAGLFSHGGAAVDVFFMLSGLVILRSLESCRFEARPFLILRVTRIFPVFLPMFALGAAALSLPPIFKAMPWIAPGSVAYDIWPRGWPTNWVVEIAAHLTMTHGLFPNGLLPDVWLSFLSAAWSLSTEWQFYVLALLLGRSRMGAEWLAVSFLVLAVAGLAWDMTAPESWQFSRAFLPNKAEYFALGIASGGWVDRRSRRWFAIVLGATLILCAANGDAGKLLPPLIWTLCLAAQLHAGGILNPLRWGTVQWLGALSYPLYLANEPIQKVLCFLLTRLAAGNERVFTSMWIPAAVLVPIGVAALLHRYVEQPALRWGRDLARGGIGFGHGRQFQVRAASPDDR
jgi:peptidoglycan/LPS O-acetylase OafA/YrhL